MKKWLLSAAAAASLVATAAPHAPAALAAPSPAPAYAPGTVVALGGTPHIWLADAQGQLHWSGDTRALTGRAVNWGSRAEVTLDQLKTLPVGDPWLSTGLLKLGDPIYLVKWE